jgi:HAD superfamily phosphoserine phosphatase-like hydrolase
MIKAVIFDLDGTLAPGISWLDLTRDLGGSVTTHSRIFKDFQNRVISYEESKRRLLGLWQGTGTANRDFIAALFKQWPLHPAAPVVLRKVQRLGLRRVIMTGSVDLYAEVVAQRLHVSDWFANTRLVFDDQGLLVDYHYERDQAGKKAQQLEYLCTKYKFLPSEIAVVGDSDNDIELFHRTGKGILLEAEGQSAELHDAAWQTVEHLPDILHVLESAM